MAPQRKGGGRPCVPSKRPLRKPENVPRILVRGGVQVLEVRSGPDSIVDIECFLQPRMGEPEGDDYYGYSELITVGTEKSTDTPPFKQLPCYSAAQVQLPNLNPDLTCETLLMWEAVSTKTEVLGISSLVNVHSQSKRVEPEGIGYPIAGINYHFFAVGGQPLDLQALVSNFSATYPAERKVPVKDQLHPIAQVLDPNLKTTLDEDGTYPIEVWGADPSKNDNTRYFGTLTGGAQTPPVLSVTNTTTTILLDEYGVGPLCKGGRLYLAAADICGFSTESTGKMRYRGLPRFFKVKLRKRAVKNPYAIGSLLNSFFSSFLPQVKGQPMTGDKGQVEEVTIFQGTEPLPADPDLIRSVDQFGQFLTKEPAQANVV
ncbi:major capsid protein VP1 [African elephant polyomavirus 1]|uniref:Major capsid protein VP1 n=1 Tax=African elephant polyomavirus 1 TaxID=1399914 RepID=T2FFC5_9POLY|nr:major capsid protein VP1 [African elephant polyomavirus 1]AGV77094.1 major capsid protein VP1 [African elephant polyomavirus 1]